MSGGINGRNPRAEAIGETTILAAREAGLIAFLVIGEPTDEPRRTDAGFETPVGPLVRTNVPLEIQIAILEATLQAARARLAAQNATPAGGPSS